ncbi:hypothetical protein FOZ60_015720 [Perkinsus olseni]|uniref:Heparan-alpha-glucosaminide N-acetyltransferase n=1 Tax=Perkinsus olseni TaxID=32597 RepID=A0A7J6PKX2_PEROL|nr:hypothetical protein FOZ60_015720 [Perkinsus olseni]
MAHDRAQSSSQSNTMRLLLRASAGPTAPAPVRVVAVDVMRGVVMSLMLIVDVCGKVVPSIGHAPWHGFHLADIVMPGFIFSLHEANPSRNPHTGEMDTADRQPQLWPGSLLFRAPGILQRIAVCYAAGVFLRKLVLDVGDNATLTGAIKNHSRVLAVGLGCIVLHWAIMLLGPQPEGCPLGSLTPECNTAGYIDRLVFGDHHIKAQPSPRETTQLVFCGILLAVLGAGLGTFIPVNKALWTPSYCILTGGICVSALGILSGGIAEKLVSVPFKWLGMNAILFFCLSDCSGLFSCLLGSVYWADPITGNVLYVVSRGYTLPSVMLTYTLLQLGLVGGSL